MTEPNTGKRVQQSQGDGDREGDEKISDLLGQMHGLVQNLGENLEKIAEKQEEMFLDNYRTEMYEAQKKLREFNENNNEEELKHKMDEKEENLKHQREVSLMETLEISNKLKELKHQLGDLTTEAEGLDDEVRFVEEQMVVADEKNARLKQELEQLQFELEKEEPEQHSKVEDQQQQRHHYPQISHHASVGQIGARHVLPAKHTNSSQDFSSSPAGNTSHLRKSDILKQSSVNTSLNQVSFMRNVEEKDLATLKKELEYQKSIKEKLKKLSQNKCFEQVPFENLFYSCVKKIYFESASRKGKNVKLPNLTKGGKGMVEERDMMADLGEREMEPLYEISFTDAEKKLIMEEFLSTKDVKDFIISRIFPEEQPAEEPMQLAPSQDDLAEPNSGHKASHANSPVPQQ